MAWQWAKGGLLGSSQMSFHQKFCSFIRHRDTTVVSKTLEGQYWRLLKQTGGAGCDIKSSGINRWNINFDIFIPTTTFSHTPTYKQTTRLYTYVWYEWSIRAKENITNNVQILWYIFFCEIWEDQGLRWNPADYGGQQITEVNAKKIWTPVVGLRNRWVTKSINLNIWIIGNVCALWDACNV